MDYQIINENELVPYSSSPLPSGPYLVFAPHPDDETLGMGGTIVLAAKAGIDVHIVFVTDGEKGGDPDVRKKEAQAASEILGVRNIFYLNLPDREVACIPFPANTVAEILEQVKPGTIFLPSFQEFHPDHRATTHCLLSFFEHYCKNENNLKNGAYSGGKETSPLLWFYEINRQGEVNRLIDISSVLDVKESAIECYSSQLEQLDYKLHALCLNCMRSITLGQQTSYAEGFWCCHQSISITPLDVWKHYYEQIHSYQCTIPISICSNSENTQMEIFKGYKNSSFYNKPKQCSGIKDYNTLISVIVRTKNRLSLLEEALESIAGQTWPYIEAVVVNDGSDDVAPVIEKFHKYIYITVCVKTEEKNGRVAAANKGIETATGEWIMFLDDDDLLDPYACFNLLNKAAETYALVVYGKVLRKHYLENGDVDISKPEYVYGRVFDKDLIVMENYIPFNALMINRKLACQVYPLREELTLFEDWDFLIALSRKVDFIYLPVQVAIYRCRERSTATGSRFSYEEIVKAEELISQKWHQNITFKNILSFRNYIAEQTKEEIYRNLNMIENKSILGGYIKSLIKKILLFFFK